MLNGERYAQRLRRLIYLHLSTDCFMKISLHLRSMYFLFNLRDITKDNPVCP